jgi:hypothetical protein
MSAPMELTPVKLGIALRPVKVLPTKRAFEYAITCLHEGYDWKNYDDLKVPSVQDIMAMLWSFEFDEVYYFQEGANDMEEWMLFVRVGDLYIYYEAWCDLTGFECQGRQDVHYSKDLDTIWNNGLRSESVRNEILRN